MNRMQSISVYFGIALFAVPATADVAITPDVVYGHKDGMALVYDVFQPAEANGASVLYMVSGGWFSGWAPPERRQRQFGYLFDAGFTVFAVQHGSAPRFKVPDAVADVRRAVRHVRMNAERFGIDPDRLGVMGGSAGGHLALMLGLASDSGDANAQDPVLRVSNRVQAVVAYFPPVDLSKSAGPNERFPALDFDPALAPDVSPILFVSEDDPPVLLIHGDEDRLVPLSNSERMGEALDGVGVANNVVVLQGAAHGFRDAHRHRASDETVAFLTAQLVAGGE
ncbi:MAG: alpha/beta hydrolase [Gammaproteobacteria bacterium]|nr:alpha/beta hydrolase [Gammaproteobacteria bacterium]